MAILSAAGPRLVPVARCVGGLALPPVRAVPVLADARCVRRCDVAEQVTVNAERLAALELAVSRLYELADAVMDVRGTELPAPPQFDASGSWVAGEEFERAKWLAEMVFYDR